MFGPKIRYCADYKKVNVLSKTDSFPIPRMENCIDRIGKAKYITNCNLPKVTGVYLLLNEQKKYQHL